MADQLSTYLHTHFGFTAFRPGQAEAIKSLMAGRHTLAVMPTGAGKSLIYQLVALRSPGVTLVISPLIALMNDQVHSLTRRQIPATYINSLLSADEQIRRLQSLSKGEYRLVYIAPERLRSVPFREALQRVRISLLAVDEAHCISEWGHDFRPDYMNIGPARRDFGDPVTVALTATATPEVQDDIVHLLDLQHAERIITGFNRPNLTFRVCYAADTPMKLQSLKKLIAGLQDGTAIIYVGTRRDAEEVAEFAREVIGIKAEHYHAGLEGDMRSRVQDAFLSGKLPVVVATNAFGMGIDRPDVRLVVHYSVPGTLEAYYQEAGRAGRDGKPAEAVLLYSPQDRSLQEWFIENSAPAVVELKAIYYILCSWGEDEGWATVNDLSLATGLNETKIKVGLAQLESAGAVEHLGDSGGRMLLRLGKWDGQAVAETVTGVQERREHRMAQLGRMVGYAESNGCRRRILLDHFGDKGPADARQCCDNCSAQDSTASAPSGDVSSLSPSELIALYILDALRRIKWGIGRGKLAQILRGSKAKDILQFGYEKNRHYGKLAEFSRDEITDMIDQLVGQGYIKVIGGKLPVLRLTSQGEKAIQARAAIPLHLTNSPRPGVMADGSRPKRADDGLLERVVYIGRTCELSGITELIAALEDHNGNIRRLAASALGKIRDRRGVIPLLNLLARETKPQVRQYAVKALGKIGDPQVHNVLKQIAEDMEEKEYTRVSAVTALRRLGNSTSDEVASFLSKSHPRLLTGPWYMGWALGFHSSFSGADWRRSGVGELAYRLKYQSDASSLKPLLDHIFSLCRDNRELCEVDAIIPVPPSVHRDFSPVSALADALGAGLGLPVQESLVRVRATAPQKEMRTLVQKHANISGAFSVCGDVAGKRVLVVDDLFDSGTTLTEAARVLSEAGAARICVLTLTRTIHSDA